MYDEPHDYHYYMAQARKYREMADNLDGYQRRAVMGAVQDYEAKARNLLREQQQLGPKSE